MRKALYALIAAVAAIQIFLAIRFYGFLTGDDVEVLQEAFRSARGWAYQPWEIRNLFVPDFLVAPFVWIGGVRGAAIPFIALPALASWVGSKLAWKWGVGGGGGIGPASHL